ncbi:MAG: hypothetical protein ACLUEQ_02050 [Cloacibacillus evryensis]
MSGGWTTDQVGMIIGNNPPTKSILTNLGGTSGARISAFRTETGGSRVAICQYSNVNNPNGGDDVLIYDPYNTDWKKPLKELPMDKNPVSNVRGWRIPENILCLRIWFATVARFDTTNDAYKRQNVQSAKRRQIRRGDSRLQSTYMPSLHAANPWEETADIQK